MTSVKLDPLGQVQEGEGRLLPGTLVRCLRVAGELVGSSIRPPPNQESFNQEKVTVC